MRILLPSIILLVAACTPKNSILTTYNELPVKPELEGLVGQKVVFEAKLAEHENQHMIKSSFDGRAPYICIEPLSKYETIDQLLAYSSDLTLNKRLKGKTFKVFGVIGKLTGAGKGGGFHTEYYLDLDKVE